MIRSFGSRGSLAVGIFLSLLIGFAVAGSAQMTTDNLLTIACGEVVQGLKQTGQPITDKDKLIMSGIPEARDAAASVVSSRLTDLAVFEATRPPREALEKLAAKGGDCAKAVLRALVSVYSRDKGFLEDPTIYLPDPALAYEVNLARADAIYNHLACSSAFRFKDPRELLAEHEAVARGVGTAECPGVVTADGAEPWWREVFRSRLSGLWQTYGPFLSRADGGVDPFTIWGDGVCGVLLDMAENDADPMIRAEAAEAYFSIIRPRRLVGGTNTNMVYLCPEGLVGAAAPTARDFRRDPEKYLDPVARLKLTLSGSSEFKIAAAYGAAKALADLKTLTDLERILGVGLLTPEAEKELQELLTGVELGGGVMIKEKVLDLITLRATSPEARKAAALALGLTWEDMLKRGENSTILGPITEESLISFYWSSQIFAPSVGVSVFAERATAIVAPLARIFAGPDAIIKNFTVHGMAITGLADLKL
jgi:hypothetical protein